MGNQFKLVMDHTFFCKETGTLTFPLWDLSGRLTGYQAYNWEADKVKANPKEARYFTRVGENFHGGIWGLEFYDPSYPVYVVEGIFDAIMVMRTGRQAIALLSCRPMHFMRFRYLSPAGFLSFTDGDSAGNLLANFTYQGLSAPLGSDPGGWGEENIDKALTYYESLL